MKIAVGTVNSAKIESVRKALEKIKATAQEKKGLSFDVKEIDIIGIKTESGVNAQPLDEQETIAGAMNRAKAALESGNRDFDFGIGIESGISKVGEKVFEGGWVVIIDRKGEIGLASSNRYELRSPIMNILNQGKELSEAVESLTGLSEVKTTLGMSGVISNGIIDRSDSYVDAVILGFGPFLSDHRLWI
jgi:inosine/xanthosine triphosphatase